MLGEGGAEITEGVPAELLKRKRENQQRQQEIAAVLTGVNTGGEQPKKSLEELQSELDQLQTDYDSIENEIRTASPRYATLTAPKPLTLEEIRRQVLGDDTALLEYTLGEERSYLFAVTSAGLTLSRLPGRAEIERQAAAFRRQIIPASLRRSLTELVSSDTEPAARRRRRRARLHPLPRARHLAAARGRGLLDAPLSHQDERRAVCALGLRGRGHQAAARGRRSSGRHARRRRPCLQPDRPARARREGRRAGGVRRGRARTELRERARRCF
jgi:hypothetical protein